MILYEHHKNCLGTMDFILQIGKMKKPEEFCTYPIQRGDNGDTISLQSSHRWAELNTKTGEIHMSARRAQYADSVWFFICMRKGTLETDQATKEQLDTMLAAIRGTASLHAGGDNALRMFCDNSNANLV